MASVSLFNLSAGTTLASGDILVFCDISDTTQSANGSDLKITLTNFFAGIPVPVNVTSASATALAVGRLGATTPAFTVDASTASQVAGLKVTGAATGGTVAVVATDSGSNTSLTLNAKGSGTIGIGTVSTGLVTITPALTVGGVATLTAGTAAVLTFGAHLSGTSFNSAGNVTLATDAASTNTVSTIVARDSSGNFAAGTITASLTGSISGNAATATALQTARTINGTSFDGTANITVTAAAGTLTGGTLASNVLASSLTSVGVLAAPHFTAAVVDSGGLTVTAGGITVTGASTITGTLGGITTLTATSIVGAVTGNASTATALQTARTINGTSFDGTANITVTAAASTLTGTTLASNVVTSSLTAVGTLASGAVPASLVTAGTFGSGSYTFPGALAMTGALTGVTTLTTSGAINATGGAVNISGGANPYIDLNDGTGDAYIEIVAGVLRLTPRSGQSINLNATVSSGAINGQTISSAASLTGTLTVAGAATFSGTLTVGTSSLGDSFSVFQFPGTSVGLTLRDSLDTSGAYFQAFRNSAGTIIGSVNRVGTTSAVIYNTTSDYRQKNNIRDLTGSGAFIDALKPRTWEWVSDGSIGSGFVAHEFVTVSPSSVSGTKDAVNVDGEPIYQGMQASTSEVIAHIVAELQSLRLRVAQCEV